jgi:hypothetical protein
MVCTAVAVLTATALAKRLPPEPVTPVVAQGLRYSAEGDGRDQYVLASNATSGKELWKVKVFHTHVHSEMEQDVQWVFITNLKLVNDALLVRDEKARCYSVDLKTHRVHKTSCGTVFTQQANRSEQQ